MMLFVKCWWRKCFPKLTENAATDALCRILNNSPKSRKALTHMLRKGGFDMPQIDSVKTQVTLEDRSCPDMTGYDKNRHQILLVESKFWAPLRSGQASNYLQQTTALLFIVPEARVEKLWSEIVGQIGEKKLGPTTSKIGWRSTMVTQRRLAGVILSIIPEARRPKRATKLLALVSWGRLLRNMANPQVAKDIGNLVKRLECQGILPVCVEETEPRLLCALRRWLRDIRDFLKRE